MTELQKYFQWLSQIEEDSKDHLTWHKYGFNIDNVEDMAHRYLNEELPQITLSPEAILASKSSTISDAYRFDEEHRHDFDKYVELLKKYKTTGPIILYRGVSEIPWNKMLEAAKELGEAGTHFYEKGFMSCSLLPEKASKFKGAKQLKIFCPPFNNIIYFGHLIDAEEPSGCRYECLIQRGAKLKLIYEDEYYYYVLLKGTENDL